MRRDDLTPSERRVIDTMAWLETKRIPMPWSRTLVAYAAAYRPRAGFFKVATGALRKKRLISFPVPYHLALEQDGRVLSVTPQAELDQAGLERRTLGCLEWAPRAVMRRIFESRTQVISRPGLFEALEMPEGTFRNAVASLAHTKLVVLPDRKTIGGHPDIFPAQLAGQERVSGGPATGRARAEGIGGQPNTPP